MSEHKVEVVRVGDVIKHENADTLGIVHVWGYTAIVRLGDFKQGDLAVYVEPDYVVPDEPEYAFLKGHRRIKARRLRGVWSQGLLLHAAPDMAEGDNVMERLRVEHYEPPQPGEPGVRGVDPDMELPHPSFSHLHKYDVESWRRYGDALLVPGERIIVTEKIHGANARYAFRDGRMWAGSRTNWKRPGTSNVWWRALEAAPWVSEWCESHPDCVLYGEVFGQVQDLKYGAAAGDAPRFLAFDVLDHNAWMDAVAFRELDGIERAPLVYDGPYEPEHIEEMSRMDSMLAKHLAEGIVIKPAQERSDMRLGRVALKLVSDRYLERA